MILTLFIHSNLKVICHSHIKFFATGKYIPINGRNWAIKIQRKAVDTSINVVQRKFFEDLEFRLSFVE
jgi:hypothetical protein